MDNGMWQTIFSDNTLWMLLAALAATAVVLRVLLHMLRLRQRFASRRKGVTPTLVMLLFLAGALLLVKLTSRSDFTAAQMAAARVGQGAYLGLWLACVPVVSPNKRWDKT